MSAKKYSATTSSGVTSNGAVSSGAISSGARSADTVLSEFANSVEPSITNPTKETLSGGLTSTVSSRENPNRLPRSNVSKRVQAYMTSSREGYEIPPVGTLREASADLPVQAPESFGDDTNEISESLEEGVSVRSSRIADRVLRLLWSMMRKKRVLKWSLLNLLLGALNLMILFLLLATFFRSLFYLATRHGNFVLNRCLYEYSEWSACSATCWAQNATYPTKTRHVVPSSVIRTRGNMHPPCLPSFLEDFDIAPCNTYKCPTRLSNYSFYPHCFKMNAKSAAEGCYRIRKLPTKDMLITLDATLYEKCEKSLCREDFNLI